MTKTANPVILNNINFHIPGTKVKFTQLNLSFCAATAYGIVGANGSGKSTLLKIIAGIIKANTGSVLVNEILSYLPQQNSFAPTTTVAEVLGIADTLQALQNISNGSIAIADYELAEKNWELEDNIQSIFTKLNINNIITSAKFKSLSGGQKTKVFLAKILLQQNSIILLDEPSNNLDLESREILYNFINDTDATFIIVSHDRKLLNNCDHIIEINSKGIQQYGGNYDFYQQQKQIEKQAIAHEIAASSKLLQQAQRSTQSRTEKHQQSSRRGKLEKKQQIAARGSYNKIEMKAKQGKSEATQKRINTQSERIVTTATNRLQEAKSKQQIEHEFNIDLTATKVANNKIVLEISKLSFAYSGTNEIISNLSLKLTGPERVALMGSNGCGKSTLLKLIMQQLQPNSGTVQLGVSEFTYLDQEVSMLDPKLSILENYLAHNPTASEFTAYANLARFKFRNKDAHKLVANLSGGEKMRAGLAISLMAETPPQLLILDEPSNHLDLEATVAVEKALQKFQGAVLVISHDHYFLQQIGITRELNFSKH